MRAVATNSTGFLYVRNNNVPALLRHINQMNRGQEEPGGSAISSVGNFISSLNLPFEHIANYQAGLKLLEETLPANAIATFAGVSWSDGGNGQPEDLIVAYQPTSEYFNSNDFDSTARNLGWSLKQIWFLLIYTKHLAGMEPLHKLPDLGKENLWLIEVFLHNLTIYKIQKMN